MDIAIGLIGGLGLFLFGMSYMGDGLQRAAGERMKNILAVLTKNKFMGLIVGTIVTMIIQSSSATTVMTVGFVNAGLMNLQQAVGIIMGANIGTTVTALLVSLSIDKIAPLFIGIGVFIHLIAKKKKIKDISQVIIGFGILFLGMNLMKDAVQPLKDSTIFMDILSNLNNPFLGILAGFGITALLQSSSATTGLLIAVASGGGITIQMAFPIIFGQNIGTCVTALLSSVGANKVAKRASVIHLLFNVIGTVLFLLLLAKPVSMLVLHLVPVDIQQQIAAAHILFNVVNVIILFPFSNLIVKAATALVKGEDEMPEEIAKYIDKRLFATPSIALAQAARETLRMGKRTILSFLVKLDKISLTDNEKDKLVTLMNTLNDIERVGDHADNIAELSMYMIENNVSFSNTAKVEVNDMFNITKEAYGMSLTVLKTVDTDLAYEVIEKDKSIDVTFKTLRTNHIERLNNHVCEPNAGIIFLDTINNLERIGDHSSNIALTVIEVITKKKNKNI